MWWERFLFVFIPSFFWCSCKHWVDFFVPFLSVSRLSMAALFSDSADLTVLHKGTRQNSSDVFDCPLSPTGLMSNLEAALPHRWRSKWLQHSRGPRLSGAGWFPESARGGAVSGQPIPGSWASAQAAVWLLHVFIPELNHVLCKPNS